MFVLPVAPYDHGDAVEEKRRGERAEQEIFHRGFVRWQRAAAEAGKDVARDRAHLEADEGGDEFVGAREDAHAGRGEQNERVVFAALDAFLLEIVDRAENRERGGGR